MDWLLIYNGEINLLRVIKKKRIKERGTLWTIPFVGPTGVGVVACRLVLCCHGTKGKHFYFIFIFVRTLLISYTQIAKQQTPFSFVSATAFSYPSMKVPLLFHLLFFTSLYSPVSCDNVSLGLYYESLCPYSARFIVDSLAKIFTNGLINVVDLNLVPWGNAKLYGNHTFKCQVMHIISLFH
ncbi:hypothetical protein CDL12_19776 [Handroanthus impetiginosus]|uniref:Uncharacterized protein n=1 Tax=Handroanthus impetiginosus TaxID=429701 RepID=A0A2G9GR17_9LAMI|nr:hypothetical protein CDL12_19776 [Handroanthus impetiginosus]